MRFAISIPQTVPDTGFDAAALRRHLARAEELGFDSGWVMEQVLGTAPLLGPIETLTFAASCTERLRLGCAVFVTPLHNPLHLAKSLATLDNLSGGRLEVGVGAGGSNRPFAAFGVDPEGLTARFTEGVRLLKALWTQPRITFQGRFWQLTDAGMEPKPVQRPHPPLWFGGSHPNALRRAVRHGDGFMGAGSTTTERFTEQVALVRAALADQQRDPSTFRIAKRVYLTVDDDVERGRQRTAETLTRIYGEFGRTLLPVSVVGSPQDVARGLREVADAGAELLLLNPLFDDAEQVECLAGEVIPLLA